MNVDSLDIEGAVLLFKEPDRKKAILYAVLASLAFCATVFFVTNGLVLMFALLLPAGAMMAQANNARKNTAMETRTINFQMAGGFLRMFIGRCILHEGDYDDQCLICAQQDITSAKRTLGDVFRLDASSMQSYIMRAGAVLKHDTLTPYTATVALDTANWEALEAFLSRHGVQVS